MLITWLLLCLKQYWSWDPTRLRQYFTELFRNCRPRCLWVAYGTHYRYQFYYCISLGCYRARRIYINTLFICTLYDSILLWYYCIEYAAILRARANILWPIYNFISFIITYVTPSVKLCIKLCISHCANRVLITDSKVHRANMGPTWACRPQMGPMALAIGDAMVGVIILHPCKVTKSWVFGPGLRNDVYLQGERTYKSP